ncbi:MAG TPA: IclR family transcriptional regulator [Firmicutes bacterium]|nr:IclR family transcriptional regulator [Bacillota bacterium]
MEQGSVQVLDKALGLLQELAPRRGQYAYGVVELAGRAGVPVATAHRLLQVLKKHGFVSQTADKRYRLGLKLMELGMMVWEELDVRTVARPHMEKLAQELEESIYLTLRDGREGVYVEKVESPLNLRITEPIGMRLPLYCGASRLAILAFLEPQAVEEILQEAVEKGELAEPNGVRRKLEEIRRGGFAFTSGEVTRGTAGVAVPIMGHQGGAMASLSAAGPDWRYPPERIEGIAERLRQVATSVEETFGLGRRGAGLGGAHLATKTSR